MLVKAFRNLHRLEMSSLQVCGVHGVRRKVLVLPVVALVVLLTFKSAMYMQSTILVTDNVINCYCINQLTVTAIELLQIINGAISVSFNCF
jgi:hypothetical protein